MHLAVGCKDLESPLFWCRMLALMPTCGIDETSSPIGNADLLG